MPTEDERLAAEADRLYWKTDAAVAEIAERLGLSRRAVYRVVRPEPAGAACPGCGAGLVYTNRSARSAGELVCPSCGAEHDIALLRELTADAGSTLRGRGPEGFARAGSEPAAGTKPDAETEAELEHAWVAGAFPPVDSEDARLRDRMLFIGVAALAGAVVGAVATWVASRR